MEIKEKIKDIFSGEHRKFAWFVVVVSVLFIGSWIFGSGNTIIHWIKLILEYKKEIGRMDDSINERTTDVDSLEKFARERFHFAAPGDDVYIIE